MVFGDKTPWGSGEAWKGQGVPRGKLEPNGQILSLCLFLETNN